MSDAARNQAVSPQSSYLVQAPAGSGKTELLTRRVLALLAIVDEPEEILALTFTRKAAAEMRARVVEALLMPQPEDTTSHRMQTWQLAEKVRAHAAKRDWHLAEYPARLQIMTLDSLTHMLARQLPLLSGFGDMPRPGEQPQRLYREAAEAALNEALRICPEIAETLLLHQDHNTVAVINMLADMLGKRDQWLPDIAYHARDKDGLRTRQEAYLRVLMQDRLDVCDALFPLDMREELAALLVFAGNQRGDAALAGLTHWPACDVQALPVWQMIADELLKQKDGFRKTVNVQRGFPAGKEFSEQKKRFVSLLNQLAEIPPLAEALHALRKLPATAQYEDTQWQVLAALFDILILASGQLQRLFSERGEADFTEIALRALDAMADEQGAPSDLLLRLDYRIHHILIDEFQDTSRLQMRLLHTLTCGWQGSDAVMRTLFMVGDPMQSIYRFRKAEVGLFMQAARNEAGLPPVDVLTLSRNFRSAENLVNWVNRAFSSIFPAAAQEDMVRGAVAHVAADFALSKQGKVCLCLQSGRDDAGEAAWAVDLIRKTLDKSDAPETEPRIGVLGRTRKQLHALMAALQAAKIPFRAVKVLPLGERPEVRTLRALLRALLHPADRESWASLLRAPCCGLSAAELFALMAGDMRPVWRIVNDAALLAKLPAQARARIQHVVAALTPCVAKSGRQAVRDLLETAWRRLLMPSLLDDVGQANVRAVFELIEALDDGGYVDFAAFDERLERLFAAPDASPEAARVELMTIHGAKGLQWDVVILPGLGQAPRSSETPLMVLSEVPLGAGESALLIAPKAETRSRDPVYDLVRDLEKDKEAFEQARLLYVACTRAESALYLSGHLHEKSGLATKNSLLALLLKDGDDCFGADVEIVEAAEEGVEEKDAPGAFPEAYSPLMRIANLPQALETETETSSESMGAEPEFAWAGVEAAPIGIALHAALQKVAEKGIEMWQTADSEQVQAAMRRILLLQGLYGERLDGALSTAMQGLNRTFNSERGRWILSAKHQQAHAEWSLIASAHGQVRMRIIDRCFVDDTGGRWIVDYKTGAHEGADLAQFLTQERQRYRKQLAEYAQLVGQRDKHRYPIRLGLYFPLLDAWDEWAADEV